MSELKLLINTRNFKRKFITETHKKIDQFNSMTSFDKNKIKSKLNDSLNELKTLNSKIQSLKFCSESIDSSEFEDELTLSDNYETKIFECISELESSSDSLTLSGSRAVDGVSSRSLLRSPTAPLPSAACTRQTHECRSSINLAPVQARI